MRADPTKPLAVSVSVEIIICVCRVFLHVKPNRTCTRYQVFFYMYIFSQWLFFQSHQKSVADVRGATFVILVRVFMLTLVEFLHPDDCFKHYLIRLDELVTCNAFLLTTVSYKKFVSGISCLLNAFQTVSCVSGYRSVYVQ